MINFSKKELEILKKNLIWIIICLLVVSAFFYISNERIKKAEADAEKIVSEVKEEIKEKEEEILNHKETIEELTTALKERKNITYYTISDGEYSQAMKILSDIYLLIENKDFEKAKKELSKFDTSTFDDTVINFKKALTDLIK